MSKKLENGTRVITVFKHIRTICSTDGRGNYEIKLDKREMVLKFPGRRNKKVN